MKDRTKPPYNQPPYTQVVESTPAPTPKPIPRPLHIRQDAKGIWRSKIATHPKINQIHLDLASGLMSFPAMTRKWSDPDKWPDNTFIQDSLRKYYMREIKPLLELLHKAKSKDDLEADKLYKAYNFKERYDYLWTQMRTLAGHSDPHMRIEGIDRGLALTMGEFEMTHRLETEHYNRTQQQLGNGGNGNGNGISIGLGQLGLPDGVQIGLCVGIAKSPLLPQAQLSAPAPTIIPVVEVSTVDPIPDDYDDDGED